MRPARDDVGVPHVDANALGDAMQLAPPKPFATEVEVPTQEARVTRVQDEEPGVLPVPAAQATQAADVVAAAPPSE